MWLRGGKSLAYLNVAVRLSRSSFLLQMCFSSDIPGKKSKLDPLQERKMIDRFRLWAKGGDGGNGCTSFRRSRHDRCGKPDGGNGGRGGDVTLECSPSVWDFSSLQHHINAKRGGHGASKNMIGSRGGNKVVQVPVGTVIHLIEGEILAAAVEKSFSEALDPWETPGSLDMDSSVLVDQSGTADVKASSFVRRDIRVLAAEEQSEATCASSPPQVAPSSSREYFKSWREESCSAGEAQVNDDVISEVGSEDELEAAADIQYNVAELTEPGERIIVARGGDGGLGNASSSRVSRKTQKDDNVVYNDDEHARVSVGLPGSEVVLLLELKSIADVGFVGMPNAGKSTLLGALSRAKPAVGHYAFTTLRPNLGNLKYEDFSITVADIPGLIRGAHENRGLGHAFLRHIERTKVLAFVLDLAAALDGRKGIPPWEQLKDLVLELEFYREGLSNRPSLIVANKIDEAGAQEVYEELKQRVHGIPIFPVCAVLEEGVAELKDGLRRSVNGEDSHRLKLDDIVIS
ncbi:hypothetical protein ACH5RR_032890 [Cinchona calisaya]|uniref:GTP-binding protein OBGM, mitochondrial n=1 Tax=Cinchona calisaya TaxID=153742 RepID=A0ABD2YJF3_9GENT